MTQAAAGLGVDARPTDWRGRTSLVALTAVGAALLFVVLRLLAGGGEVNRFILVGDLFADPDRVPAQITALEDSTGYDGQYFYRLSLSPLSTEREVHGIRFDEPPFRHQRIGYPAFVWLASGGQATAVPWAMIAVNIVGLGLIALLGAVLARDAGRSPWWGLLVAGFPGFLITLGRGLSEIVACAALLGAVVAISRRSWVPATLLLTVAALTRESTLILAVAIVAVGVGAVVIRRFAPRWAELVAGAVPIIVGLVPGLVYLAWQVVLRGWWEEDAVAASGRRIDAPLVPAVGLGRQLGEWLTGGSGLGLMRVVWLVAFLAFLVAVPLLVRKRGGPALALTLAVAAYVVLFLMRTNYEREAFFLRYLAEPYVLASALLLLSQRGISRRLPQALLLLWVAVFAQYAIDL